MSGHRSTFPTALGVRITGVDDATFAQTGEAFSTIALPEVNSTASRLLQKDDTALAYEFARKFPGVSASTHTSNQTLPRTHTRLVDYCVHLLPCAVHC